MRKILSLALAAMMLLMSFTWVACAEEETAVTLAEQAEDLAVLEEALPEVEEETETLEPAAPDEGEPVVESEAAEPEEQPEPEALPPVEGGEEEPEEAEAQNEAFEQGLALVAGGTIVYRDVEAGEEAGRFTEGAVAFAEIARRGETGEETLYRLTFDTEDARTGGASLLTGYARQSDLTPLAEEEAAVVADSLMQDARARSYLGVLLPAISFIENSDAAETMEPVPEEAVDADPEAGEVETAAYNYELSLENVVLNEGGTSGDGTVRVESTTQLLLMIYARVTWVYRLANDDSYAVCELREVEFAGKTGAFSLNSGTAPTGAVLRAVQVALVTDSGADKRGSYVPLAIAKLQREETSQPVSNPTWISITPQAAEVRVGETLRVRSEVNPGAATAVSYWSSDPKVARVDESGFVLGVSQGQAIIAAVTSNGLVARAEITVTAKYDLFSCLGQDLEKTAGEFGLTYLSAGSGYGNSDIQMLSYLYAPTGTVDIISLNSVAKAPEYALSGLYLGMAKSDARKLLEEGGYVATYDSGRMTWYDNGVLGVHFTLIGSNSGTLDELSCSRRMIQLSNLEIERDHETLEVGVVDDYDLNYTIEDSVGVVSVAFHWTSSDPGVASVEDDGAVTALRTGTAIITATAEIQTTAYYYCQPASVSCLVTVIEPAPVEPRYRALIIGQSAIAANIGTLVSGNNMCRILRGRHGESGADWEIYFIEKATADEVKAYIQTYLGGARDNDISLFSIHTHGDSKLTGSDAGMLQCDNYTWLRLPDLANALSEKNVRGKVIAVIDACGSGAAVVPTDAESKSAASDAAEFDAAELDAFNEEVIRAFMAADTVTVRTRAADVDDSVAIPTTDEFLVPGHFFILTASDYQELGYANTRNGSFFTQWMLAESGVSGAIPADANGDGRLTLSEYYTALARHGSDPISYVQDGVKGVGYAHVQAYPANSDQVLWIR